MENKKSLLKLSSIDIVPKLSIRIPTVGEILEDEEHYYSLVSSLTATPFQYMVQLDDMGIDFTTITDYELFIMLFPLYCKSDLSILFGDLKTSDFDVYMNQENNSKFLYSPSNNIIIDELIYNDLTDTIRKINQNQVMSLQEIIFLTRKEKSKNEMRKRKENHTLKS